MNVAIHQPHYFPWLGYFDKIAKVDKFVFMDEVQLEKQSYMVRNRFVTRHGDLSYLTVTSSKLGYRQKKYNEIEVLDEETWQKRHVRFFQDTFRLSPFLYEILSHLESVLNQNHQFLCDVTCQSIRAVMEMLNIKTDLVRQSDLAYCRIIENQSDEDQRRSQAVLDICKAAKATAFLTGKGASLDYLDDNQFRKQSIMIKVQQYACPVYPQRCTKNFIPDISALDLLFNCGIMESRRIFWENVEKANEFGE